MESLSPELALIDPELAARARACLPDPGDCLSHVSRQLLTPAPAPSRALPAGRASTGRQLVGRGLGIASGVVVVGFLATSLLAFIPQGESARPEVVGNQSTSPTSATLRWREDPEADAYNLVLVWGDRRIDRRVDGTSFNLGRVATTRSVTSDWYVYPLYVVDGGHRPGGLLASGSIELDPRMLEPDPPGEG